MAIVQRFLFKIKPEKRDGFIEMATELAASTLQENGVITYEVSELVTEPNTFVFFEVYDNAESANYHMEQMYTKRALDVLAEIAEEPAVVLSFTGEIAEG